MKNATAKIVTKTVDMYSCRVSMPDGTTVIAETDSYEPTEVGFISCKKLGFRFNTSNKGLYKSNVWMQMPEDCSEFFINELPTDRNYFTLFETSTVKTRQSGWAAKKGLHGVEISQI